MIEVGAMYLLVDKDIAAGKSIPMDYLLHLRPFSIVQKEISEGKSKESGFDSALFDFVNIEVTVTDPSRKYLKKPLHFKPQASGGGKVKKGAIGSDGFQQRIRMSTSAKGSFDVAVKYTLAGIPMFYKTKLLYPAKEARRFVPNLNRIKVRGTVAEDYRGIWTCRIKLSTGRVVGCEQWYELIDLILTGTPCEFEISPTGNWAHNLRSVRKLNPSYRIARPSSVTVTGEKYFGDIKNLTDGDSKTFVRFGGVAEGEKVRKSWAKGREVTITFSYNKLVKISSGFCRSGTSKSKVVFKIEAFVSGKWQVIRENTYFKFFDVIVTESSKFRVVFTPIGNGLEVADFNFNLAPARRIIATIKRQASW